MKVCDRCQDDLDDNKFEWTSKLHLRRRKTCRKCRKLAERSSPRQRKVRLTYRREYRRNHPESHILTDSRQSDKKKNLQNDLDIEFIKEKISKPCSYCGETKLRITLDRKDNSIGHLKSNVVPACIRCNYTRRDMPYEAWLLLAGGMRKAREIGAFDNWTGSVWK